MMSMLVTHYSYLNNVEKLVSLAAGCGYPKNIPVPFSEDDFWHNLTNAKSSIKEISSKRWYENKEVYSNNKLAEDSSYSKLGAEISEEKMNELQEKYNF